MIRLKKWEDIPEFMRNDKVHEYYEILSEKQGSIIIKRCFDFFASVVIAVMLLPIMLVLAVIIKMDSPGPVIFKQERITAYGKQFNIYKFRTMVHGADKLGSAVTTNGDRRITRVGQRIRKYRLDELPQIFNIIKGDMSFVGTRPEVPRYVDCYTEEMYATLLFPAGVTSLASIKYKDEEQLLSNAVGVDYTYVNEVLPGKMDFNLRYQKAFGILFDIKIMLMTAMAVLGKEFDIKESAEEKTRV